MKKIIITCLLGAAVYNSHAQTTNKAITEHDSADKARDSLVNANIIKPARAAAAPGDPDWDALVKTIAAKYDAVTADRTVTKAKIYYYYSRNKAAFCTNIVRYKNNWELADDYQLLNLNAGMVLAADTDPAELREALRWAKAAAEGEPSIETFRATLEALQNKVEH